MSDALWMGLVCFVSITLLFLVAMVAIRDRNAARKELAIWKESNKILAARVAKLESEQIDYMLQKCRDLQ